MVSEVQTATTENQWVTFLAFQSGTFHPVQALHYFIFMHFHETQAPGFQPVQECHHLIFMNLRPRFSATLSNFYLHVLLFLNTWDLGFHVFTPFHLPEQLSKLHRAFPQICPEPMSQEKTQNLKPQDFISHIPVLNSAGTALQVTPRIYVNLS